MHLDPITIITTGQIGSREAVLNVYKRENGDQIARKAFSPLESALLIEDLMPQIKEALTPKRKYGHWVHNHGFHP